MIFSFSIRANLNHRPSNHLALLGILCVLLMVHAGCRTYGQAKQTFFNDTTEVDWIMQRVDSRCEEATSPVIAAEHPRTISEFEQDLAPNYWDISLEQAMDLALANAQVLRDLGATVLRAPQALATENMQAIRQTDPQYGMEAALSAFDAQLDVLSTFQKNDRRFNNRFFGGGSNIFQQDRHDYIAQLSKRTASGSRLAMRSITDYDFNNATGNIFPSVWQTQVEGEIRQSLLQGGGVTFNRIAGPNSVPGNYNGVLIAKVNMDISQVEFDKSMRQYVSDVINAYWDLYFAYRDYDSKKIALEKSRETWLNYQAQKESSRQSGAAESLAREQYFRFQSEMQDSIAGKTSQRTKNENGTEGGIFSGVGGVQAAERRLRLMVGLPLRDDRILRPSDEPSNAPVVFDWGSIASEAVQHRPEIRKQRLVVERRRLELLAAKNFLLPQLDLFGRYRFRGLDRNFLGSNSAYGDLSTGDFQEWETGFELSVPIGFRKAHAAVQNAQLILHREEQLLQEQERQVVNDLGSMVAEADRAYRQTETNLNRYFAAADAVDSLEANRKAGLPVNLEQLLDAQRRLSDSQQRFYLSRVEYAVALKNVQLEKGSLLAEYRLFIDQAVNHVDSELQR